MEIAIKTQGLKKKYGGLAVVDSLNLEIVKGEIYGLVGPDGAGKTTTLRMLATALVPDSGHAMVMGFDVVEAAEDVKLRIGYMPQRFTLYGDLTVSENIDFFADLYQVPPANAKKKKAELLKANNLEKFSNRLADELSGGMKKKLALACTLIHTPDVIILDEPTTGVDPLSRRELWRILYSLIPQVTIVVSTPYMDEAERCSRVGLFFNGRVVISDSPINVIKSFRRELLEIKCANMREVRKIVAALPGTLDVEIFGDSLHAHVDFAEKAKIPIEAAASAGGFVIDSMQKISPKMEDVFISILKVRK